MSNKTVLIIASSIDEGASDRSALDVAIAVRERGYTPIVVSSGGKMMRELKRENIEHVQMNISSVDFFTLRGNIKALTQLAVERSVSIIHAFTPDAAYHANKAARATGIPYVASYMKIYPKKLFSLKSNRSAYMSAADFIIAPSEFMAAYLQGANHVPHDKIAIIPQWIDTETNNPKAVSAERIIRTARELRVPEDKFIVAAISRLARSKGQKVLLAALAKLPEAKRARVQCLIMSRHKAKPRIETALMKEAARLGVVDMVFIADKMDDIPALLMLSDMFVSTDLMPSAFRLHLLDAISFGRPAVASNIGPTSEYVFDDNAVRLYEPGDAEALAREISAVMELGISEREALGRKAQTFVRVNFSREIMAPKAADIYNYVLERHRKMLRKQEQNA